MQSLFVRGPSVTLRTIIFVGLSIILMIADHRWQHVEAMRTAVESLVIHPLRYIINVPADLIQWTSESISSQKELVDENRRLKDQQLKAQVSLQKLSILEKENERLRKMLSAQPKVGEKVLIAELLSIDMDPYRQQVVLNKGQHHSVYHGQPVIDAWGVMGQVVHIGEYSSTAMLITDPSHAIPVQVNRNGLRSTVFGNGQTDNLELKYIPHNADIEIGDLIITSGLGGRFPPNYPVGRIISIERPAGETFANVIAQPIAHIDRSREILLVWHNAPEIEEAPGDLEAVINE
ncbi:MAG: rod shape-determining protein MreC [Gammaproteobacteria bacterium]|nr:rod shape-determining protein MreC [Gammaproteobacteria bacterium]